MCTIYCVNIIYISIWVCWGLSSICVRVYCMCVGKSSWSGFPWASCAKCVIFCKVLSLFFLVQHQLYVCMCVCPHWQSRSGCSESRWTNSAYVKHIIFTHLLFVVNVYIKMYACVISRLYRCTLCVCHVPYVKYISRSCLFRRCICPLDVYILLNKNCRSRALLLYNGETSSPCVCSEARLMWKRPTFAGLFRNRDLGIQ